jgi:hypothetical protein
MSAERHPLCVLVAPEMATARSLADWLTDKGFPAEPVMPAAIASPGDVLGFTEETFNGIEVRVQSAEHAEPAKQAIAEMKAEVAEVQGRQQKRAERTGTVTAVCEDCGKSSDWPASAMGTTETCPHCGNYMDVPDPDENWDDVDFEEGEEDNETPA